MIIDRLRAVEQQAEALSEQKQERLAAIWEAELDALDEQEWDDLLHKPGAARFLEKLVEEGQCEYTGRARPRRSWETASSEIMAPATLHLNTPFEYSIRIGLHFCAIGTSQPDGDFLWLWIGSYAEYDQRT